ncbi:hypothetical protein [Sphingopyxis sp.]|uniref:hypothetical protein n=1 Tax=Sphingopyxis sp. TaxID=1908224 RepID=UPI0035B3D093
MFSEQWKDFERPAKRGAKGWNKDFADGVSIFQRVDDGARFSLTSDLIRAWRFELPLNRAMASGALRQAWESEPYLGGMRRGSFVSKFMHGEGDDMDEFAEDWGPSLMTPEEEEKFEAMEFPLTAYRGGTGSIDEVAQGISWTLDLEIAKFYALDWPKRWGIEREPMIVSMQVECEDVAAFLVGRKESELLVPYASLLRDAMTEVTDRVDVRLAGADPSGGADFPGGDCRHLPAAS